MKDVTPKYISKTSTLSSKTEAPAKEPLTTEEYATNKRKIHELLASLGATADDVYKTLKSAGVEGLPLKYYDPIAQFLCNHGFRTYTELWGNKAIEVVSSDTMRYYTGHYMHASYLFELSEHKELCGVRDFILRFRNSENVVGGTYTDLWPEMKPQTKVSP